MNITWQFCLELKWFNCTGGGTYSADTAIAVPLLKVVWLVM